MAEATRYSNVIVPTDGQTITGPLNIIGIKVVGGAAGATVNLRDANNVVLHKTKVGNDASEFDSLDGWQIRAQAYNIQVAAGAADIYIYLK